MMLSVITLQSVWFSECLNFIFGSFGSGSGVSFVFVRVF